MYFQSSQTLDNSRMAHVHLPDYLSDQEITFDVQVGHIGSAS